MPHCRTASFRTLAPARGLSRLADAQSGARHARVNCRTHPPTPAKRRTRRSPDSRSKKPQVRGPTFTGRSAHPPNTEKSKSPRSRRVSPGSHRAASGIRTRDLSMTRARGITPPRDD